MTPRGMAARRARMVADTAHQLSQGTGDGRDGAAPGRAYEPIEPGPRSKPDSGVGLAELVRELADDTQRLIRNEIELAKHETRRKARRLATDGAWLGGGVAVAAVGGTCLVIGMALGLGALLNAYWLGTAITGAVLLLVGGVMALKGLQDFRTGELAPRQTIDTLRDDAEWVRREVRDFKQEVGRG